MHLTPPRAAAVVCVLLVAVCGGDIPLGFKPGFPRLKPGSTTETLLEISVRLTQPANVTCLGLRLPDVDSPPPTHELFVGPVPQPLLGFSATTDPVADDPAGERFIMRSEVVHAWDEFTTYTVYVFLPPSTTLLQRRVNLWCMAAPDDNLGPSRGSDEVVITGPMLMQLNSFEGVHEFTFTPDDLLPHALPGIETYIVQDVLYLISQDGNRKTLDFPTEVVALQEVGVELTVALEPFYAATSTYMFGIADGATAWFVELSAAEIRVYQEVDSDPVVATIGEANPEFTPLDVIGETDASVNLLFLINRRTSTVQVRVQRGSVDYWFLPLYTERAKAMSGPLRLVAYSRIPGEIQGYASIHMRAVPSADLADQTQVFDWVPRALHEDALVPGVSATVSDESLVLQAGPTVWQKLLSIPVNYTLVEGRRLELVATVQVSVGNVFANDAAIGIANDTLSLAMSRQTTVLSGAVLDSSTGAVTAMPQTQLTAGNNLTPFDAKFTVGVEDPVVGTVRTSSSFLVVDFPLSSLPGLVHVAIYSLTPNAAHTVTGVRVELTADDRKRPQAFLFTDTARGIRVTAANLHPFTVIFSERPVGVSTASISVKNGVVASFRHIHLDTTFNEVEFVVEPTVADGLLEVHVPADAITDVTGNGNTASNVIEVEFDVVAPRTVMFLGFPYFVNATGLAEANGTVTATVTEIVVGWTVASFSSGGVVHTHVVPGTGLTSYVAYLTPPAVDGVVNVSLPLGSYTDMAGNPGQPAWIDFVFDSTPPFVSLTLDTPFTTNAAAFWVIVDVSELPDVGFPPAATLLHAVNGNLAEFEELELPPASPPWPGQQPARLRVSLAPTADGFVEVSTRNGTFVDFAHNPNVGNGGRVWRDATPPAVHITSSLPPFANAAVMGAHLPHAIVTVTEVLYDTVSGARLTAASPAAPAPVLLSWLHAVNATLSVTQLAGADAAVTAVQDANPDGLGSNPAVVFHIQLAPTVPDGGMALVTTPTVDHAGNTHVSTPWGITFDSTAPVAHLNWTYPQLVGDVAGLKTPLSVTAVWSEPMDPTSVNLTGFRLTNADVAGWEWVPGTDNTELLFDLVPTVPPGVLVNLAVQLWAGSATDLATNTNLKSTTLGDFAGPTVPLIVAYFGEVPTSFFDNPWHLWLVVAGVVAGVLLCSVCMGYLAALCRLRGKVMASRGAIPVTAASGAPPAGRPVMAPVRPPRRGRRKQVAIAEPDEALPMSEMVWGAHSPLPACANPLADDAPPTRNVILLPSLTTKRRLPPVAVGRTVFAPPTASRGRSRAGPLTRRAVAPTRLHVKGGTRRVAAAPLGPAAADVVVVERKEVASTLDAMLAAQPLPE